MPVHSSGGTEEQVLASVHVDGGASRHSKQAFRSSVSMPIKRNVQSGRFSWTSGSTLHANPQFRDDSFRLDGRSGVPPTTIGSPIGCCFRQQQIYILHMDRYVHLDLAFRGDVHNYPPTRPDGARSPLSWIVLISQSAHQLFPDERRRHMTITLCVPSTRHAEATMPRKLVHWINSLPLAACALVNSLLDLRHGDVLQAIVAWLQADPCRQKPPREREEAVVEVDARTQVRAITRYVAQRCRSEDGEAMYLLNEARCASRVLAGDVEAIAAVVSVLRRLVQERQEKEAQAVEEAHAVARQELVVFSRKASALPNVVLNTDDKALIAPSEECTVVSARGSSRHAFTRKSSFIHAAMRSQKNVSARTASEKQELSISQHFHRDESGFRAFSMVDPTAKASHNRTTHLPVKPRKSTQQTRANNTDSDSRLSEVQRRPKLKQPAPCRRRLMTEVVKWLRDLGIPLCDPTSGSDKTAKQLYDGTLIYHVARVVTCPRDPRGLEHAPPNEAFTSSVKISELPISRRQALKTAWNLLKQSKILSLEPYATDFDGFATVFSIKQSAAGEPASWKVWDMLRHIQNQHVRPVEQAAHGAITNTSTMTKKLERGSDMVRKRRLYLTSEQIEATTAWLKLLGVNLSPTSSSIFDDPLRNGSALCELLQRAFEDLHRSLELRYPPKTLGDIRHNISCSLQAISRLEDLHIPANYRGSQAVEATMMGDKQSIFAVLWHFWQYWEGLRRRGISDKTEEIASNDVENTPPVVNSQVEKTDLTRPVEAPKRAKPAAREAFLMDVSASKLAEEETYSSWDCRNDTNARLDIPWDDHEWSNDLFPSPRHSFESPSGAMTMEDISSQGDIVPIAREVSQMEHIHHCGNQESSISQPDTARSETRAKDIDRDPELVARTTSPQPFEDKPTVLPIPKVENSRTIRRETSKAIEINQEDIEGILCWLKLIGIRLKQPEDFQNQTARLADFQSGIVLCDIVEKVEHLRRIEGVSRAEKMAKANALHNIEKALSILQKKKTMPLHLIRQKRSVYDGDRNVILSLLLQIRKAYGYHLKGKPSKIGAQRRHPMHQDATEE